MGCAELSFGCDKRTRHLGIFNLYGHRCDGLCEESRGFKAPHNRMDFAPVVDADESTISIDEVATGVAVVMLPCLSRQLRQDHIVQPGCICGEQRLLAISYSLIERAADAGKQLSVPVVLPLGVNLIH